jgi:hypothetical protein
MMKNQNVTSDMWQVTRRGARSLNLVTRHPSPVTRHAFSLVEVLLVITLLSLIVMALMAVFSSTQRAFRASVTQTDVLEGGRMVTDLMVTDLRGLTPSYGASNGPVNFFVQANSTYYSPLIQGMPGSTVPRTNLLNFIFILGRENTQWTGTGYIVDTTSVSPLFPLYRFHAETNISNSPWTLYNEFLNARWTNMSHLMDGVVHLTVHAYDPAGRWINDSVLAFTNAANTMFLNPPMSGVGPGYGEAQLYMFSNTVPSSVELELGILEDRTLARGESLGVAGFAPSAPQNLAQWNYLTKQSGTVHVFRQRVTIPNVDTSAYQ